MTDTLVTALGGAMGAFQRRRRLLLAGAAGAVVLAASVVTVLSVVRNGDAGAAPSSHTAAAPEPTSRSAAEALAYMAGEGFAAQPADVRAEYMRRAKEAGLFGRAKAAHSPLSDRQKRQLWRNIKSTSEDMAQQRMNAYFELPPPQRAAYLDKMIDEKYRDRRKPKPSDSRKKGPGSRKGDGRKAFAPETLKRAIEGIPADERSRILEFKRAWMERCRERGIKPW